MGCNTSFGLAFLTILSTNILVLATSGPSEHQDKLDIEHFQEVLQTRVREDILELQEKFDALVEEVGTTLEALGNYTKQSIEELRDFSTANIKKRDKNLDENTRVLADYANNRIIELDSTMVENFERLNNNSREERASMIEWIHQRNHRHEDLFKSHIGLCVFDQTHKGIGVVTYNSPNGGYIDNHRKWRVFNVTRPDNCCEKGDAGCEDCAMKVLNRQTGFFTVPANAAGLYMFTFSATMDTFDADHGFSPNEYKFQRNGEILDETGLYADVGSNWKNDKVPGSRTIFLRLEDGDSVAVVQTRARYVLDHHISFCGALIHLNKASDLPGTTQSQSGIFSPPTISQPEMESVDYSFPGFQNLSTVPGFEFSTGNGSLEDLVLSSENIVGQLYADNCANYRGNTRMHYKQEECATLDGLRDFS